MKNVTIYDASGKILSFMSIPDIDLNLVTQGQMWIEAISNPLNQYVSNGQLVDMPPSPGIGYVFDYENKQWIGDVTIASAEAINKRNTLLQISDWTQIPNNPLTTEQQQEWATYRQALRDIPQQSGYPFNIIWPVQPE
jgi:hypothetical protein